MSSENLPVKAKKKQPVLQKRPNGFLYFLAARLYSPLMCKRKFNLVSTGERVEGIWWKSNALSVNITRLRSKCLCVNLT